MNKKFIVLFMAMFLLIPASYSKAEEVTVSTVEFEMESDEIQIEEINLENTEETDSAINRPTRASRIVLSSFSYIDRDFCAFSLSFIGETTGNVTATLQRKVGTSWVNVKSGPKVTFSNIYDLDSQISVSSLAAGAYRLKFALVTSSVSETLYTNEATVN